MFLYMITCDDAELELAHAELRVLTGANTQDRMALSAVGCDISRAAYISQCGEILARAPTVQDLVKAVANLRLHVEGFRVEVKRLGPVSDLTSSMVVSRSLADVIGGSPNLKHPRAHFQALCGPDGWQFLRLISVSRRGYQRQSKRPHNFSYALPARAARALVNLAAAPGDTLVDPCCGVGTCLLEACEMGIRATGCDVSAATVYSARGNLRHFSYECAVQQADARALQGTYDAAIVDFPYGHASHVERGLYAEVLAHVAPHVRRLAVVLGDPAEDLFAQLGLAVLDSARVRKHNLVRHYYLLAGLWEG
jgi:tRNA (guanine10-N2)-dimethyltransferase